MGRKRFFILKTKELRINKSLHLKLWNKNLFSLEPWQKSIFIILIRQWWKTIFLYSIIHRNNNQSYLYLSNVISILRIQLYQRSYRSASIIISCIAYSIPTEVKIVSPFPDPHYLETWRQNKERRGWMYFWR